MRAHIATHFNQSATQTGAAGAAIASFWWRGWCIGMEGLVQTGAKALEILRMIDELRDEVMRFLLFIADLF